MNFWKVRIPVELAHATLFVVIVALSIVRSPQNDADADGGLPVSSREMTTFDRDIPAGASSALDRVGWPPTAVARTLDRLVLPDEEMAVETSPVEVPAKLPPPNIVNSDPMDALIPIAFPELLEASATTLLRVTKPLIPIESAIPARFVFSTKCGAFFFFF